LETFSGANDLIFFAKEGMIITLKEYETYCKMLTRGLKQSDKIIIEDCGVSRFYAKRRIYNRIHFVHQNISEVYIRTGETLELLYRKGEG